MVVAEYEKTRVATDVWITVINESIEMLDCLPDTQSEFFSSVEMIAGLDIVFYRLLLMLLCIKVFYTVASVCIVSEYAFLWFEEVVLLGGIDLGGRRRGDRRNIGSEVGAE